MMIYYNKYIEISIGWQLLFGFSTINYVDTTDNKFYRIGVSAFIGPFAMLAFFNGNPLRKEKR